MEPFFLLQAIATFLFVKGPTIKFDPEEIYMFAIVSSDIDPAPKIISGRFF